MGLYMQKALSEWISIFVAMIESTLHPWLGVSFSRRASFMHLGCRLPRRERVSVPSFLPTLRTFVACMGLISFCLSETAQGKPLALGINFLIS